MKKAGREEEVGRSPKAPKDASMKAHGISDGAQAAEAAAFLPSGV